MLVLTRKKGEAVMIGDEIELVVLGVEGDSVKIGVNAPKQIGIFRKEIYTSIQVSNREASRTRISPDQLGSLFPKK